jgi:uncharacterized membrane protein
MKDNEPLLLIIIAFVIAVGIILLVFHDIKATQEIQTNEVATINELGSQTISKILTNNTVIMVLILLFFAVTLIMLLKGLSGLKLNKGRMY